MKEKKTYGRTPDGTTFTVPHTHDMVSQLLDPRQPKNLSDALVLTILGLHILIFYHLPVFLKQPIFAAVFLFWRGCYNVGIGYLLHTQSHQRHLVVWAKKMGLFEDPKTGRNKFPWLYPILKRELEAKIPRDYLFEKAPIEYNTWLLFRRVVDLILMCDFTSYCLFAIACGQHPLHESPITSLARWGTGVLLVGFNLWVKLDAHRVVKDYAWYWGDFFYLIDQELTFDGVFEMAPHPMYSVGYAGYYGISMMAASYRVLFISIIAHAAQFAFLVHVENPHIEKTYNPPPTRKRNGSLHPSDPKLANATTEKEVIQYDIQSSISERAPVLQLDSVAEHKFMGLGFLDLFRATDLSILILLVFMVVLTAVTPSTPIYQAAFFFHALFWRVWNTVGLGVILHQQSKSKLWTRHFVKYGETTNEAWKHWKGMYHLSLSMCYSSFIAASWKMYSPADRPYGLVLFKHVLGTGLIALQVWTAASIYDSLGEFGWFFGDFFFDKGTKLTYSGIYRFLNNPERIIGLASIWGAVLITRSPLIFFLALVSHMLSLGFIQYVEKPHMQKLYGRNLRAEAGLTKSIRRSLPPPLKKFQDSVDKVFEETSQFVGEFVDAARPKFASGVSTIVRDTTALFSQYPARLTLTRLAPDLAGYNPRDYHLEIEGVPSMPGESERVSEKGVVSARFPQARTDQYKPLMFEYGAPIIVRYKVPMYRSENDWVGLYMVADNASREVTRVSSAGRWLPVMSIDDDSSTHTIAQATIALEKTQVSKPRSGSTPDFLQGEMVFEGDKLWWTQGVFEFRYHHDGKHNVMATSLPFEICIRKFEYNGFDRMAVESALLPVVRNCFDRDLDIAPNSVLESFGSLVERDGKYIKRVVYAVHQMFGLELASQVVLADGNVRNLAQRICIAKQALAPYSVSHFQETHMPVGCQPEVDVQRQDSVKSCEP
ncbi:Phosphatidylethanolamine [Podosphaera aphanis]|nr:Phosphatidylethanolamine [Podosphaera aphanis]